LTVSAVKSRLHRARRALAGMWQEEKSLTRTSKRRVYESPAF
jgi:DNA-directed RNA polymerase specialized sigma24 family protein